jgi:hypothetical protein
LKRKNTVIGDSIEKATVRDTVTRLSASNKEEGIPLTFENYGFAKIAKD